MHFFNKKIFRTVLLFFFIFMLTGGGLIARPVFAAEEETRLAGIWADVVSVVNGKVVKDVAEGAGEALLGVGRKIVRGTARGLGFTAFIVTEFVCSEGVSNSISFDDFDVSTDGSSNVKLSWLVLGDNVSCKASGSWGGSKPTGYGQSETLPIVCGKTYVYGLTCESIPDVSAVRHGICGLHYTAEVLHEQRTIRPECDPGTGEITTISTLDTYSGAGSPVFVEPPKNIEVDLKGPEPDKRLPDGTRAVKKGVEVEYTAVIDHYDDDEDVKYRFKCNEDRTGRVQKVDSKKDKKKFRCTYNVKEEKFQDPVIRVRQDGRGKAKYTKRIWVYIPGESLPPDPDDDGIIGGGDVEVVPPAQQPAIDIRVAH